MPAPQNFAFNMFNAALLIVILGLLFTSLRTESPTHRRVPSRAKRRMQCNKIARAKGLASLFHDLIGATEQRDGQPSVVAVLRLRTKSEFGSTTAGHHTASAGADPFHRCMKPSVSVCIKLTNVFSSSSERPSRPTNLLFMLSVDSGAGQHVVPSPGSLVPQRRRTSRVL